MNLNLSQPLTILHTIFDSKGTTSVYLLLTNNLDKWSLNMNESHNQNISSIFLQP